MSSFILANGVLAYSSCSTKIYFIPDCLLCFKISRICKLPFPNLKQRRALVYLHDINHVISGSDTTWVGEGEVAAIDLCTALDNGDDTTKIPNIWANLKGQVHQNPPRPLIQNLDWLPYPDIADDNKYYIEGDKVTIEEPWKRTAPSEGIMSSPGRDISTPDTTFSAAAATASNSRASLPSS